MKITYRDEMTAYYSKQSNCTASIYVNDKNVGYVDYVLYKNELTVSHIFIEPEYRRMGLGSRLMKFIQQENPNYKYKPSWKTDDGLAFKPKDVDLKEELRAKTIH